MQTTTLTNKAFFKTGFILFAGFFTATILLFYSYLLKELIPSSNLVREYFICFGQIIFQATLLLIARTHSKLIGEYLYKMMMVSFAGSILLLPVLVSAFIFFPFTPGVYYFLAYFFAIVIYMFFLHKKNVQSINAPWWLSYTWVIYRLIVLLIILF